MFLMPRFLMVLSMIWAMAPGLVQGQSQSFKPPLKSFLQMGPIEGLTTRWPCTNPGSCPKSYLFFISWDVDPTAHAPSTFSRTGLPSWSPSAPVEGSRLKLSGNVISWNGDHGSRGGIVSYLLLLIKKSILPRKAILQHLLGRWQ